jgi:hypothetical protein
MRVVSRIVEMRIPLRLLARKWVTVAFAISFAIASLSFEARAQAPARKFKSETYRSLDLQYMVRFISPTQLEYQTPGEGKTRYKYERSRDGIRLIHGRNSEIYFRIIPEGLDNGTGAILLSPAAYEKARASG